MDSMTTDNEQVSAYVPPAYKKKLKEYAVSQERSVSFVAGKVLREFIDKLINDGAVEPFSEDDY